MKSLCLYFILSLCVGAYAKASISIEKANCRVKQHIFLIHGIGGKKTTFGELPKYLKQKNPCYLATNFVYDTGNSSLTTHDFADGLDAFVRASMKMNGGGPNDRVSLIMHSQGGIVGSLWLHKIKNSDLLMFKRVDSFITLSTPYWGATIARRGRQIFYTMPTIFENPFAPFGRKELLEMSYGSNTIKDLQSVIHEIFGGQSHVRGLAVGGIKSYYSAEIGEDDTAVSAYSSRPDHIFMNNSLDVTIPDGKIEASTFSRTNFMPFVAVAATHFKLDLPGVAKIPKKCLRESGCNHPSLALIMDQLDGKKVPSSNGVFSFRKFRVHLYLENLEQFGWSKADTVIEYNGKLMERHKSDSLGGKGTDAATSFTGILQSTEEEVITLQLRIKDQVKRTIQVPVQGGYATFIKLNLTSQSN